MTASDKTSTTVAAEALERRLTRLFSAAGLSQPSAQQVSRALIDADLEGIPSHGVLQAGIYLDRLRAGTASSCGSTEIVIDSGAIAVLDAHHMIGHLASDQA